MIKTTEISSYKEFGKVLCITNDVIEAYITLDVGPRIIRFGFVGGQNFMRDDRSALGAQDLKKEYSDFFGVNKGWENLGGHRIWISPESFPETYYPDVNPVDYEITDNGAVFTPKAETENGVAKQLEIRMDADDANMQVVMRVTNISNKNKEFAVWGLTVSERGGTEIIPMNTNDTGLLSNRIISVWPYTDMSDDRIYWGNKYVTLKQDASDNASPLKLGFDLNCESVFYVLGNEIFCKRYQTNHPNGKYPDGGCSFETYTNSEILEIESLGELKTVKPQETSELIENWSLQTKPCEVDFRNDDSIDNLLNKI